jgi:hypothetical protein
VPSAISRASSLRERMPSLRYVRGGTGGDLLAGGAGDLDDCDAGGDAGDFEAASCEL